MLPLKKKSTEPCFSLFPYRLGWLMASRADGPFFIMEDPPPQPDEKSWTFVEELRKEPYHRKPLWKPRSVRLGEISLKTGVCLAIQFDDPEGFLETAWQDFRSFLAISNLSSSQGFPLLVCRRPTSSYEEFYCNIREEGGELCANDTEGIRRGLVWIEDEMLRRGGPFLPLGVYRFRPVVRTRLSRCFYGPVNRPPKQKDELLDDEDYYPDAYLDRLAHESVNGLWLTIHFFNTIPSKIIPEYGRGSNRRLAKLRRVVEKCRRYGIKIYPFCIEPAAFSSFHKEEIAEAAAAHPDLIGHQAAFCTSSEKGKAYLEEATRTLFTEVPGLGGLIVIPVGERFTHCYSSAIPYEGPPFHNSCPRCSKRMPWEVVAETLSCLAAGMHAVDPSSELIAWPYGQSIAWGKAHTIKAASHIPPEVILQHNFESGGKNIQLGKARFTWDYWLSYTGPSSLFQQCADAALRRGVRVSAKLQVSCSHEVATTQVVPVPGILYRKYQKIHQKGVSSAMLSWYFGTYPSLMTRAAGLLSFSPFPETEKDFLHSLALRDWGEYANKVVSAWNEFSKGYAHYPTSHIFGYFGPAHDGPVWPLYLIPRRLPLSPTWQIGYPPSGDYIAECVTNGFTLKELCTLCNRMAKDWNRGVAILQSIAPAFAHDRDRTRDIGIARALGLQFSSTRNILQFYDLRESLAESSSPSRRRLFLQKMKSIVQDELAIDKELLSLSRKDSRLGFHSEAEGYKYYPERILWRMRQLQLLLKKEFPFVEEKIEEKGPLFPSYTGEDPDGPVCVASLTEQGNKERGDLDPERMEECGHWLVQRLDNERRKRCSYDPYTYTSGNYSLEYGRFFWHAVYDSQHLSLFLKCFTGSQNAGIFSGNKIQLFIEPCRTLPRIIFTVTPEGEVSLIQDDGYFSRGTKPWKVPSRITQDCWSVHLSLPWEKMRLSARRSPIRCNLIWTIPTEEKERSISCSWAKQIPVKGRLVWGTLNPAEDFGWLFFDTPRRRKKNIPFL